MNTAYEKYLHDALGHYMVNDDDEAVHRFLEWLHDYTPDKNAVKEPGIYEYGDAQGQYAPTYVDEESLTSHHIDPDKLTEQTLSDIPSFLDKWATTLDETLTDRDCMEDALERTLDGYGTERDSVTSD